MRIEIITPSGLVHEGDVDSVTAPGVEGKFQVLNNHANLLSSLAIGAVVVSEFGNEKIFSCGGGVLEVNMNNVIILSESSEYQSKIDLTRAEQSRDRAEKRLAEKKAGVDIERAKASLLRAINRVKIASQS